MKLLILHFVIPFCCSHLTVWVHPKQFIDVVLNKYCLLFLFFQNVASSQCPDLTGLFSELTPSIASASRLSLFLRLAFLPNDMAWSQNASHIIKWYWPSYSSHFSVCWCWWDSWLIDCWDFFHFLSFGCHSHYLCDLLRVYFGMNYFDWLWLWKCIVKKLVSMWWRVK